ncbi:hypothetical protein BC830DRAFT_159006 [Chytriomyces sp. MP71]|nr:hypothetical protein BC830DRAFT_159006 [Chytriomyces sp. MP71]
MATPPCNGLPRSDSDNTLVDNIVERSAVAWKEPLLTLDEAVELHQRHVLGVNNEETPGIADVPETAPIQSAAVNSKPKVVATIRIEYPAEDCSDWSSHTFFSPSFPEELEALLLDSVFQSRMLSINQELGQFSQWGLVDLIPIVRTLMTIIFFVVTGVVLSGSLTTGLATWFITLAIMFLMMIATYAFKPVSL